MARKRPVCPVNINRLGKPNDGSAVEQYILRNSHGMQATVITYGGVLQALKVPDKHGKVEDVVLGFDDVQGLSGWHGVFWRDHRPLRQSPGRRCV